MPLAKYGTDLMIENVDMDEQYYVKLQLKASFGRLSYIAWSLKYNMSH